MRLSTMGRGAAALVRSLGRSLARRMPRKIVRDERGAAAIEFAIVAIPFITMLAAIMETALLFLADQILDTAVNDAARLIRTGQATDTTKTGKAMTHDEFNAEICKGLYVLFDCSKIASDVRTYTTFSSASYSLPLDKDGNIDQTQLQYAPGTSQGIVVVRVYYLYPLVFPQFDLSLADVSSSYHLMAAVAAFRNEPYPW